jgi:L-aspartate oxidase
MSGMEFTAVYTIAPAQSTMAHSTAYAFATYYDADGQEIDLPHGPDQTLRLARQLLCGPVYCSPHKLSDDIKVRLHTISPNVPLVFDRWGIDSYRDRFEVTLHNDGTILGIGGVRVVDADCATSVPGLFVAGDNASREKVAGAISGGGNVNSAWALSSGTFAGAAGAAAAALARKRAGHRHRLRPLGQTGLRPRAKARSIDVAMARAGVRAEMHPYDKNLFRAGARLAASRRNPDALWTELADHASGGEAALRVVAALVATARWSVATAAHRTEGRGMHRREDHPALNPGFAVRLLAGGLDEVWVAPEQTSPAAQSGEMETVS